MGRSLVARLPGLAAHALRDHHVGPPRDGFVGAGDADALVEGGGAELVDQAPQQLVEEAAGGGGQVALSSAQSSETSMSTVERRVHA